MEEQLLLFPSYNDKKAENLELFKARKIKAMAIFEIREIPKNVAYEFVKMYHYLKDAKFFSQQAFGMFYKDDGTLMGVATFCQPQGTVATKGWFGLTPQDKSIYELSRLCMLPSLNGTNATSFLLGGAMRLIKKQGNIRAIITLADSSRHVGSIYQVCNFKYYGLTDVKSDFWCADGTVNPRGGVKHKHGVWLPRTRKHRYCYLIDKSLQVRYKEQHKPSVEETADYGCCNGTHKVYDKRFNEWYTCPKCTGKLTKILQNVM
jgi:hypothetical protein